MQAEQQSERKRFEAYIAKDCGDLSTFGVDPNRHYRNSAVNNAWVGWQARAALSHPSTPQGWQDIATAPKDRTEILACWPKRKLDDDECPTGEITGYAQCVTAWQGFWIEPDYLDAHGSFYFEDEAFAEEPTHWMPLPPPPEQGSKG